MKSRRAIWRLGRGHESGFARGAPNGARQTGTAVGPPSIRIGFARRSLPPRGRRSGYRDWRAQRRDLLSVRDAVEYAAALQGAGAGRRRASMTPGPARPCLAAPRLAHFLCPGPLPKIEPTNRSAELRDRDQHFTGARSGRLRGPGFQTPISPLGYARPDHVANTSRPATPGRNPSTITSPPAIASASERCRCPPPLFGLILHFLHRGRFPPRCTAMFNLEHGCARV